MRRQISTLVLGVIIFSITSLWAMEDEDKKRNSITRLPKDVLYRIFSMDFTPKQLGQLARVLQQWQSISEDDVLWERFGVKSKNEFRNFMNGPVISIFNTTFKTKYAIGVAYGSGPYFTDIKSEMKGASFDSRIVQLDLPIGQKTVVRFCDLPEETTILGPQQIYGLITLPGVYTNSNSHDKEMIRVDGKKSKLLNEPCIYKILGASFRLRQDAVGLPWEHFAFEKRSLR